MVRENEIREAEVAVAMPSPTDAGLLFIGRAHTPWTSRGTCSLRSPARPNPIGTAIGILMA